MTEDVQMFVFLTAGIVALFTFLSLTHWISSRKAERIARERLALYRKLAEMPPEAAGVVLARLRDEDARQEQEERVQADRRRRTSREGGLVVLAAGVGLSIFLKSVAPGETIWTLGMMLMLMGLVIFAYTFFDRPADSR